MATHSSVLAWRIPGTGEPGGLPSMWSHSRTRLKRLSSSSSNVSFNPNLKSGNPGSADGAEGSTWIFQLKQRVNLPFLYPFCSIRVLSGINSHRH